MLKGLDESKVEEAVSELRKMIEEPAENGDDTYLEAIGILRLKDEINKKGFIPFEKGVTKGTVTAIDGGSVLILDGYSSFHVSGVRASRSTFIDARFSRENSPMPTMHIVNVSVANNGTVYSKFFRDIVGDDPKDQPRSLEEVVGRIRSLVEWREVESALQELETGSILAFDGTLWAGIKGSEVLLERIVTTAKDKGIMLCGVSKRSALTYRGIPAIPIIQMFGEKYVATKPWYYKLELEDYQSKLFGEPYVVCLAARSRYVFKVDISLPDGMEPASLFSRLATLSNDPGYFGYPYPLAKVHNEVAFSRTEVENMRHLLEHEAAKNGMDMKKWHLAFQNFHDILDGGR